LAKLEELIPGAVVEGVVSGQSVTVVAVTWQVDREAETAAYVEACDPNAHRYRASAAGEHVDISRSQSAILVRPERARQVAEAASGAAIGAGVRAIRDFDDLFNEVAAHLEDAPDASVTITVEINASSAGFDDRIKRTVSENATQLGFDMHEFED